MNWLEALYQTYENNSHVVGEPSGENDVILMPTCHTSQNAQICVTLNESAEIINAEVIDKSILVPCTEDSGGRTGIKPKNHPLADKLQYLAGDYLKFGGDVTKGFAKEPAEPHKSYLKLLSEWQEKNPHPKVKTILEYIKKNQLIADLIKFGILPSSTNEKNETVFLKAWTDKEADPHMIFKALPNGRKPEEAFICWKVVIPNDLEDDISKDATVWQSWIDYYESTQSLRGLCYIKGNNTILAKQHPAKIRHAGDKAKLISANDSSGFTFRGRFTDKDGEQVCGVGFDVTQKAHNALRWLIARQGIRFGDLAIVAWSVSGSDIPDPFKNTLDLFDEDFESSNINIKEQKQVLTSKTLAEALNKKLKGYHAELKPSDRIIVLAVDSATPGRMVITYYRVLAQSEFLQRLEKWHSECAWEQNYSKDKKFLGAPSSYDIAIAAYGSQADDKLKIATYNRLIPCIIENQPIPSDLISHCFNRLNNRLSFDNWEWNKNLGIFCALYRKYQLQTQNKNYIMSLEKDRTTRSYLYGRLLAIADVLEQAALTADENRPTNAARLMQRFSQRPYDTWTNIYLSLDPYKRRLKASKPGLFVNFERQIDDVKNLFRSEDFSNDEKLKGEFLLAYHCQRSDLYTSKKEENTKKSN